MPRVAVPSKGRIYDPTMELFERAGLEIENGSERQLFADTMAPDVGAIFARAADIPEYVQDGAADIGVSSMDFVAETGADVEVLLDLGYGSAEIVLAVPEDSGMEGVEDLPEDPRVVTEFPNVARDFLDENDVGGEVIEVSGATEMAPQVGIADAIIDLTSTGTTLRMNRLEPIESILETSARVIGNPEFLEEEPRQADRLVTALESVVRAKGKRYLVMNVLEEELGDVMEAAPGLSGPTVTKVESEEPMLSVQVVVDSDEVYETVAEVREAGARDVLVMPIERMIE